MFIRKFVLVCILVMLLSANSTQAQDRSNVQCLSRICTSWRNLNDFDIVENRAYLATDLGIWLLDISNLREISPVEVYYNEGLEKITEIDIRDNLLYAGVTDVGIMIFDITQQLNFELLGIYEEEGANIHIENDILFLTNNQGLSLIDVSNPNQPALISRYRPENGTECVVYQDTLVYIQSREENIIEVVNVADHENLERDGLIQIPDGKGAFCVNENILFGFRNYIEDGHNRSEFTTVNIGNPNNPVIIGSVRGCPEPRRMIYAGHWAFYQSQYFTYLIDVSNPVSPEICFEQLEIGAVTKLKNAFILENTLYTGCEHNGLNAFNIADPDNPELIGGYNQNPGGTNIIFVGNEMLTCEWNGICRYDISHPRQPELIHVIDPEEDRYFTASQVTDSIAFFNYLRDVFFLLSVNVTESDSIEELCRVEAYGLHDIYTDDRYTYCVGEDEFAEPVFFICDIHDPENLEIVSHLSLERSAIYIEVFNDFAYLSSPGRSNHQTVVYDITDRSHPEEFCELPFRQVCIYEELLLATDDDFKIFYNSDPMDPDLIESFEIGDANVVRAENNSAYVSCGYEGLKVFDFSDLEDITEIGYYDTPGYANDIRLYNGLAFVYDKINLGIYRFNHPDGVGESDDNSPTVFTLYPAYPNPFNSTTTVGYSVPSPMRVTMTVHDLLGRKIFTCFDGFRQVGEYRQAVSMDGMASGEYIIKVSSGGLNSGNIWANSRIISMIK